MIGLTLGVYFAKHFLRNTLAIFLLFFFLIVVVDMIELTRQIGQIKGAGFSDIAMISLFRAPGFAENVLPFAVLFGASATLIILNRKLELVVARASGVSVWQFLFPVGFAAGLIGILATFVYNPMSLIGQSASKSAEASVFGAVRGSFSNKSKNFWIRVNQKQGDVVIRAQVAQDNGTRLSAVSVYKFNEDGGVTERFDAKTAQFVEGSSGQNHFLLTSVKATIPGERARLLQQLELPVDLTKSKLQSDQVLPDKISIWELGDYADNALETGKNANAFLTKIQSLLSQPVLFIAMVLIAATVSLRFARFGLNGKAILGGVLGGFVLYVFSKLVVTFGSNGLVSPFVSAWTPALVASLIGVTVLLHQEDG